MKWKYIITIILAITVLSGLAFSLPVPVAYADDVPEPEIGESDRINFLDGFFAGIFDNDTRTNLASNLIFGNTTAYVHLKHNGDYTENIASTYVYGLVYTGVKTSSGKKIYIESSLNISNFHVKFIQNISLLMILWDNDKSFINFLNAVNNATKHNDNESVNNLIRHAVFHIDEIFTGDEMLIIVPVFFWKYDINLDYNLTNYYIIDEDDDGPLDDPKNSFNDLDPSVQNDLLQAAQEDPSLEPLVNTSGAANINSSYASFFFMITEFWAKRLYWGIKFLSFSYDFDFIMATHRLMGAALYNDSNDNGLMDVEFAYNETSGKYYPVVDEAMFSIDLVDAQDCVFTDPIVDENEKKLSWNAKLVDPTVRFTPWGVPAETAATLNTTEVQIDNTSFGFTFTPQAVQSGRTVDLRANLKFDHVIGAFNGTSGLTGKYSNLDLAILYMSDVFEMQSKSSFSRNTPENNATMKSGGQTVSSYQIQKTSSKTETLEFFIGNSRVTGLDLCGENYSINDSEPKYKANAAVIPYATYSYKYLETGELLDQQMGSVEAEWNINTNFSRSIGAYIVTYPDFNGSKIVHDPEFSMFGTITTGVAIPGFEWILVFPGLAIVAIVVAIARKKKIELKI
ncbi:MAG: hypothetical protein ACTSRP_26225 [Candidatus Helarchaeota archaeon]